MERVELQIREGEHQGQAFIIHIESPKQTARILSAFANTDGGRLIVGVKGNGKVVGVFPEEQLRMLNDISLNYCKPPLTLHSDVYVINHKKVLELSVDKAKGQIIKALDEKNKWRVYIRHNNKTILANKILLAVLKQTNSIPIKPNVFNENEQLILTTIQSCENISLSQLYQKTKLNKDFIDKFLVQLIVWGIVAMNFTEKGTFYTPSDKNV